MPPIRIALPGPLCPLRVDWLQQAALLPGKALHVALVLMVASHHARSSSVVLTRYPLSRFGVSRDAGYDALTRLVEAGLVMVSRRRGRYPRVTLVDPADRQPLAV